MVIREAGGVVVDPTTGGEVDFLARCLIWFDIMIMHNYEEEGKILGERASTCQSLYLF